MPLKVKICDDLIKFWSLGRWKNVKFMKPKMRMNYDVTVSFKLCVCNVFSRFVCIRPGGLFVVLGKCAVYGVLYIIV